MMLSTLLDGMVSVSAEQDCVIASLTVDSREAIQGSLFIALKGTQQHGLDYASVVAEQGASAIIWESDETVKISNIDIPQFRINQLREVLGDIANRFYGFPSRSLNVVGITGTDGKTSVSHFIAQATEDCAVMGTLGIGRVADLQASKHTTPDVISTHANMVAMTSKKIKSLAMEVSSHALQQGRVSGVDFNVAVLTNLSRDHLDYHGTLEAYAEAKAKLFAWSSLDALVLNLDDVFGQKMLKRWGGVVSNTIIAYGVGAVNDYPADALVAESAEFNRSGISAQIHYGNQQASLMVAVLGRFNLSNLLAALGAMLALDYSLNAAVTALNTVQTVAGRMEKISAPTGVLVVIDYAHTPNALETVLKALREHTQNKLICVFGCGGDRDTGKRPLMATIVEERADVVIVTDDNPRTENPEAIVQDITAGFVRPNGVTIEHDRAKAISTALKKAQWGDTVLIAGKGHEKVQILATGSVPFSDREQANKVLQELAA